MRCLWIALAVSLMSVAGTAQIPNSSFENWEEDDERPVSWEGDTCCLFKVTESTDGIYALRVASEQQTIEGKAPGFATIDSIIPDEYPVLLTADIRIDSIVTKGKGTIEVVGVYENDSNSQVAFWRDTVEYDSFREVSLEIDPNISPDYINIAFGGESKIGILGFDGYGSMIVDNVRLEEPTDTGRPLNNSNKVTVFPNPAQNNLHIRGIEQANWTLYNLRGFQMKDGTLKAGKTIDVSALHSGYYVLKLIHPTGQTMSRKVLIE